MNNADGREAFDKQRLSGNPCGYRSPVKLEGNQARAVFEGRTIAFLGIAWLTGWYHVHVGVKAALRDGHDMILSEWLVLVAIGTAVVVATLNRGPLLTCECHHVRAVHRQAALSMGCAACEDTLGPPLLELPLPSALIREPLLLLTMNPRYGLRSSFSRSCSHGPLIKLPLFLWHRCR